MIIRRLYFILAMIILVGPALALAQESFISIVPSTAPVAQSTGYSNSFAYPKDTDLDGKRETYVLDGATHQVAGIESSGQPRAGFPVDLLGTVPLNAFLFRPAELAFADLDGDSQVEMILSYMSPYSPTSGSGVVAVRNNGQLYSGWPNGTVLTNSNERIINNVVVAQLNSQPSHTHLVFPVLKIATNQLIVRVLRTNGTVFRDIILGPVPSAFGNDVFIAVGDVDNDGNDDLAAVTTAGLYLVNINTGALWPNFPRVGWAFGTSQPQWDSVYPAIADINGDGYRDIVISDLAGSATAHTVKVLAVDRFDYALPGWPVTINNSIFSDYNPHRDTLTDVTGDGIADVVVPVRDTSTNQVKIYAYSNTGNLIPGWPYTVTDPTLTISNITAIDVTNDGRSELFFTTSSDSPTIDSQYYQLNSNGSLRSNYSLDFLFPFPSLKFDNGAGTSLTDLNGDGDAESVLPFAVYGMQNINPAFPARIFGLLSLDLNSQYPTLSDARRLMWSFGDADAQNTRSLAPYVPPPTPTPTPTPTATPTPTPRPSGTPSLPTPTPTPGGGGLATPQRQ